MNLRIRYRSKSKKRFIRFFIFYSFLALFLIIYSSLGKYTLIQDGTLKADIANWQIKINNNDIKSQTTLSNVFELTPNLSAQTTTDNKLVPGKSGYFDIIINPENTDVSIEYNIKFDTNLVPQGLQVVSYEIIEDGITNNYVNTGILGEINLTDNAQSLSSTNTKTIRIFWKWSEDTTDIPTGTESYSIVASVTIKQKI